MSFSKVGYAIVVVVPGEFDSMLAGALPSCREGLLLRAVWALGYLSAERLHIAWCVPAGVRRLACIHRWRESRQRDDSTFALRQFPPDDFYPLVGAEVMVARRAANLTIVWSHSHQLLGAIARSGRGLSPVVLVGIPEGLHRVPQHRGGVVEVQRRAPGHFLRPSSTVREVHWWDPSRF